MVEGKQHQAGRQAGDLMAIRKKRRPRKPAEPKNPKTVIPGRSVAEEGSQERFRLWRGRVNRAQELRKKWEQEYEVDKCANFYLGKQRSPSDTESVVLNYFLATIKTEKPNLFLHKPKMFLRPKPGKKDPAEQRQAAIGEGILDSIATQDDNLENAGNLAVLQNFWRMGALKVIYNPRLEPNPKAGDPIARTDASGRPITDPQSLKPLIDSSTGQPIMDPQTGEAVIDPAQTEPFWMRDQSGNIMKEPKEVVTDELYRYLWVNAKNMLLPDEGPDESRWGWIGEEIVVTLEEAKEDTRFSKNLRDSLVHNETLFPSQGSSAIDTENKDLKKFRYFELYDIKEKKLLVIADGQKVEDFLFDDDLPDGIEDHPYALLRIDLITDPEPSPWPMPLTRSWLDPQKEYNISRNQVIEGGKRSARKGYFTEGTFDDPDEAIKLLQSPRDMEFAKVADPANPPKIIESPDLNDAIYKNVALLQNEWPIITGQTGPRLSAAVSDTATEASFIEKAANLRDIDMQKAITKWLSVAGRKMFQLVKATLTLENWIKMRGFSDKEFQQFIEAEYGLTGAAMMFHPGLREIFRERFGRQTWLKVTREDLQFEADVGIEPGSARPRNTVGEQKALNQLAQTFGQWPQMLTVRKFVERVLKAFDIEDDGLVEELMLAAKNMIEINANQAGRSQGGSSASGGNGAGMGEVLAGALSQG